MAAQCPLKAPLLGREMRQMGQKLRKRDQRRKGGQGRERGTKTFYPVQTQVIKYLSRATMSQVFLSRSFTWGSRSLARGAEGTGWDRQNERSKEMASLSLRCA